MAPAPNNSRRTLIRSIHRFNPPVNHQRDPTRTPLRHNSSSLQVSLHSPAQYGNIKSIFAYVNVFSASRQQLPSMQTEANPDQYYPQSATAQLNAVFSREVKSPRHVHPSNMPAAPSRGAVPKFQKIKTGQDLQPRVNAQPAFRRANPEGGFISVRAPPPPPRVCVTIG
jgi:hypothetical protein